MPLSLADCAYQHHTLLLLVTYFAIALRRVTRVFHTTDALPYTNRLIYIQLAKPHFRRTSGAFIMSFLFLNIIHYITRRSSSSPYNAYALQYAISKILLERRRCPLSLVAPSRPPYTRPRETYAAILQLLLHASIYHFATLYLYIDDIDMLLAHYFRMMPLLAMIL